MIISLENKFINVDLVFIAYPVYRFLFIIVV